MHSNRRARWLLAWLLLLTGQIANFWVRASLVKQVQVASPLAPRLQPVIHANSKQISSFGVSANDTRQYDANSEKTKLSSKGHLPNSESDQSPLIRTAELEKLLQHLNTYKRNKTADSQQKSAISILSHLQQLKTQQNLLISNKVNLNTGNTLETNEPAKRRQLISDPVPSSSNSEIHLETLTREHSAVEKRDAAIYMQDAHSSRDGTGRDRSRAATSRQPPYQLQDSTPTSSLIVEAVGERKLSHANHHQSSSSTLSSLSVAPVPTSLHRQEEQLQQESPDLLQTISSKAATSEAANPTSGGQLQNNLALQRQSHWPLELHLKLKTLALPMPPPSPTRQQQTRAVTISTDAAGGKRVAEHSTPSSEDHQLTHLTSGEKSVELDAPMTKETVGRRIEHNTDGKHKQSLEMNLSQRSAADLERKPDSDEGFTHTMSPSSLSEGVIFTEPTIENASTSWVSGLSPSLALNKYPLQENNHGGESSGRNRRDSNNAIWQEEAKRVLLLSSMAPALVQAAAMIERRTTLPAFYVHNKLEPEENVVAGKDEKKFFQEQTTIAGGRPNDGARLAAYEISRDFNQDKYEYELASRLEEGQLERAKKRSANRQPKKEDERAGSANGQNFVNDQARGAKLKEPDKFETMTTTASTIKMDAISLAPITTTATGSHLVETARTPSTETVRLPARHRQGNAHYPNEYTATVGNGQKIQSATTPAVMSTRKPSDSHRTLSSGSEAQFVAALMPMVWPSYKLTNRLTRQRPESTVPLATESPLANWTMEYTQLARPSAPPSVPQESISSLDRYNKLIDLVSKQQQPLSSSSSSSSPIAASERSSVVVEMPTKQTISEQLTGGATSVRVGDESARAATRRANKPRRRRRKSPVQQQPTSSDGRSRLATSSNFVNASMQQGDSTKIASRYAMPRLNLKPLVAAGPIASRNVKLAAIGGGRVVKNIDLSSTSIQVNTKGSSNETDRKFTVMPQLPKNLLELLELRRSSLLANDTSDRILYAAPPTTSVSKVIRLNRANTATDSIDGQKIVLTTNQTASMVQISLSTNAPEQLPVGKWRQKPAKAIPNDLKRVSVPGNRAEGDQKSAELSRSPMTTVTPVKFELSVNQTESSQLRHSLEVPSTTSKSIADSTTPTPLKRAAEDESDGTNSILPETEEFQIAPRLRALIGAGQTDEPINRTRTMSNSNYNARNIKLFHFKRKPDMNKLPFYKRPFSPDELQSLNSSLGSTVWSSDEQAPDDQSDASNSSRPDEQSMEPNQDQNQLSSLLKRKRRAKSQFDRLMAELHSQQPPTAPTTLTDNSDGSLGNNGAAPITITVDSTPSTLSDLYPTPTTTSPVRTSTTKQEPPALEASHSATSRDQIIPALRKKQEPFVLKPMFFVMNQKRRQQVQAADDETAQSANSTSTMKRAEQKELSTRQNAKQEGGQTAWRPSQPVAWRPTVAPEVISDSNRRQRGGSASAQVKLLPPEDPSAELRGDSSANMGPLLLVPSSLLTPSGSHLMPLFSPVSPQQQMHMQIQSAGSGPLKASVAGPDQQAFNRSMSVPMEFRVPKLLVKPMRPAKYSLNGYIPRPTLANQAPSGPPKRAHNSGPAPWQSMGQQQQRSGDGAAAPKPRDNKEARPSVANQVSALTSTTAGDSGSSLGNENYLRQRNFATEQQVAGSGQIGQPMAADAVGAQFRRSSLEENKRKYVEQHQASLRAPALLSVQKVNQIKVKLGLIADATTPNSSRTDAILSAPSTSVLSTLDPADQSAAGLTAGSRSISSGPTVSGGAIATTGIPKTDFECTDKQGRFVSGRFADTQTGCQVWHLCSNNRKYSFICPLGTIFNAKVRICDWRYNVKCSVS